MSQASDMFETKPFKIIIIGGGLAGSLLGNGLMNNNVDFAIYERDAEDSTRGGYQIRLGESAIKGFRACLSADRLEAILKKFGQSAASGASAPCIYSTKFKPVLDLTKLPTYTKSSAISRVVLRDLLREPVVSSGNFYYGKSFSSYLVTVDGDGNEKVKVTFADGTTDDCDILIGADGSGSVVNNAVGLQNLVSLDTHWAFLAKGKLPRHRLDKLPSQLQKGPVMVFAKGLAFFYALYLPVKSESESPATDKIDYDETDASFYWGLTVPRAAVTTHHNYEDIEDRLQFCLDMIRDWAPEYKTLITTGQDDKETSGIYVTPLRASNKPAKNWREQVQKQDSEKSGKGHPRVWLLGDAIHAMQPNRGMGGNQAMHDCADMLPYLLELNQKAKNGLLPTREDILTACNNYESTMIDRAFTWVSKSGGTSIPNLDFDGILGSSVSIIGKLVVPVISFLFRGYFSASSNEID